ncbi:MAG TPA: hypothetical protein VEU55_06830 [Gemmatimonadales bacterium]|nr:hypothetical protein [Gemmatimonadales bacterium]
MVRRSRLLRAGWSALAALQLLVPGAAAWADARLDVAGAHATAHVESHSTDSCARVHPPDCALCHFLTAPFVSGRPTALRWDRAGDRVPGGSEPAPLPHGLARAHPHSRAPPPLS